jgi:hypothetical protein
MFAMLAPLIVAPLAVGILIMLAGWIHDSVLSRVDKVEEYPFFPASARRSRGVRGAWGIEPPDCGGLTDRSTGWMS